jgi:hypothetical protein
MDGKDDQTPPQPDKTKDIIYIYIYISNIFKSTKLGAFMIINAHKRFFTLFLNKEV